MGIYNYDSVAIRVNINFAKCSRVTPMTRRIRIKIKTTETLHHRNKISQFVLHFRSSIDFDYLFTRVFIIPNGNFIDGIVFRLFPGKARAFVL